MVDVINILLVFLVEEDIVLLPCIRHQISCFHPRHLPSPPNTCHHNTDDTSPVRLRQSREIHMQI
ncbi:hypothetical protein CJ030_MR1G004786 [Morella rubra]|uniref:Uncharacterized protein n=1 Tax=Morella rubra TaxID=262757 RepID=A0A6A1WLV1_9ROSI|nr:hypothetical protein CJ030_MR1G004786 [Morella rubra]